MSTHVFERAGLGVAPFKVVGNYVSKFQAIPGDPSCPVQPGSACDYCAQGIMNVYVVRGADGREFKVGCDCVAKAGDRGLKRAVDDIQAAARRDKAEAKRVPERERIGLAAALLVTNDAVRARFAAAPHPKISGKSELDYLEWVLRNAGHTGKLAAAKSIERVAAMVAEAQVQL